MATGAGVATTTGLGGDCTAGNVATGTGCAGGEETTSLAGITATGEIYRMTTSVNCNIIT